MLDFCEAYVSIINAELLLLAAIIHVPTIYVDCHNVIPLEPHKEESRFL